MRTYAGSSTFTVTVTDANGKTDSRAVTLVIKTPASVALTVSSRRVTFGSAITLTAT